MEPLLLGLILCLLLPCAAQLALLHLTHFRPLRWGLLILPVCFLIKALHVYNTPSLFALIDLSAAYYTLCAVAALLGWSLGWLMNRLLHK